uniref:Uncharacterized protein n=1 Tax=Homalodisca liturata TaxID=320908 RepID=A0A1B6JUU5_9HEMI
MADSQETKSPGEAEQAKEPQVVNVVEPEKKQDVPSPAVPQTPEDLSQLTPAIMESLCFEAGKKSEQELRTHIAQLQGLLGKVIELLKDKSAVCSNLEKQNTALMLQSNSLKDVVAITKDLLSIRNMEVEHLHVDIKSMEEKINIERERHNNMLNRMSEAVKLNENLKAEYQSQLGLFNDLRARYEEKVTLLERENKRLSAQISGSSTTNGTAEQTEHSEQGVELSLNPISPP